MLSPSTSSGGRSAGAPASPTRTTSRVTRAERRLVGVGGHGELTAVHVAGSGPRAPVRTSVTSTSSVHSVNGMLALCGSGSGRTRHSAGHGRARRRRHVLAADGHRRALGRADGAAGEHRDEADQRHQAGRRRQAVQGIADRTTRCSSHVPSRSCWITRRACRTAGVSAVNGSAAQATRGAVWRGVQLQAHGHRQRVEVRASCARWRAPRRRAGRARRARRRRRSARA